MVEFGNNRHDWYTLNHMVYRNTEEKFLKRVICYAGKESKDDSSNKVLHLFSDINRTNVMTKDEVINAFLNGMIIVDPQPLHNYDTIVLGDTTFQFIAFCNEEHHW